MSTTSRQDIRTWLRQVDQEVKRVTRRFAPVDREWSAPDHAFFIRADMGPCCDWHNEYAFQPYARPL